MIVNYRQAVPMAKEQDEHTLLLLHGDGFFDSSMYERVIENYEVSISSTQSKFGGYSMSFNGNSYFLISNPIDFGSEDFTIDWWEYCTSSSSGARFCSMYNGSKPNDSVNTAGGLLLGYAGKNVYASNKFNNTWPLISAYPMFTVTLTQWVHWACVRFKNTFTTYRNGDPYASTSLDGTIYYDENRYMIIGSYQKFDKQPFYGYIDEFRISDVARWTSAFTPPTKPYSR